MKRDLVGVGDEWRMPLQTDNYLTLNFKEKMDFFTNIE